MYFSLESLEVFVLSFVEKLIKELEADEGARKRLARLLVVDVVSEPEARLAIVNAILREVATKSDLDTLRKEFKADIDTLRKEFKDDIEVLRKEFRDEIKRLDSRISSLEQRVARLEGSISLFIKLFIGFNLPLLVSVIAALVMLVIKMFS